MANGIRPYGGRSARAWTNRRRRLLLDESAGGGGDPYWDNVQLLLPWQTDNYDDSGQARGEPTVFIGAIDSYTAFGAGEGMGASYNYAAHGANDSYYWADAAGDFTLGSGDFTIEYWYQRAVASNSTHMAKGPASGEYEWGITHQLNGAIRFHYSLNGTTWTTVNAIDFVTDPTADWVYVSMSRQGNNLYGALNGEIVTTTDVTGLDIAAQGGHEFQIGYSAGLGASSAKNLSNLRITVGTGRYDDSSFTPPTAPFSETNYE